MTRHRLFTWLRRRERRAAGDYANPRPQLDRDALDARLAEAGLHRQPDGSVSIDPHWGAD